MEESQLEKQQACPFCQSTNTELVSIFGQTLLSSQFQCHSCHSFFEAIRFNDQQATDNNVASQRSTQQSMGNNH